MTVEDLIRALEKYPRDHRVYIDGIDGGVDDLTALKEVHVLRDINRARYYGAHSEADPNVPHDKPLEAGVLLG